MAELEATVAAVGPGIAVAAAGVAGLLVALVVRDLLRSLALERTALFELRLELERREAAVTEQARAVAEWEGRLHQVVECGCGLPRAARPAVVGPAQGVDCVES